MKYLLDTCVISDIVKGEKHTLLKLKNIPPNNIAVSTITVMEINYGLILNPDRAKKIKSFIADFLMAVSVLDYTQGDAEQTGKVRANLKQLGQPIGSYDILLAGTALNNQLIFVTSNVKEFNKVKGLMLENWRIF